MASITVYLQENLPRLNQNNRCHVAPSIENSLIDNAIRGFSYLGDINYIIGILDSTVFRNAKDGLLFTAKSMIYKPMFKDPVLINYENIESTEFKLDIKENGYLEIIKKSGDLVTIELPSECDLQILSEILDACSNDFAEYKKESLMVSLDKMSEKLKSAYTKIIINMAFDNDGEVDEKELAEILLLMTRLNFSIETRLDLRSYISSVDSQISVADLITIISDECEPSQGRTIHVSLVKDLINTYFSTGGDDLDQFEFLHKYRDLLKVSDKQIELVVMAIENDRKMLKEDMTDDQFVVQMKALGAKAASVGTPIAAVYISGSVIGLSAAGMTSGLATLGMGGFLGLSSMATGIGVAVLIGVGTYAGIKKLTGADELDGFKRRELMLNDVLKQTQKTISLIMDDINYVVQKFNNVSSNHSEMKEKFSLLLSKFTSAGTVLTQIASETKKSCTKIRCARFLDERKLKSVMRDPTHKEVYNFIIGCYEKRTFKDKDKEPTENKTKLVVRKDISQDELESLEQAFDTIGYFNASDVMAGAAQDIAEKAKNTFTGLFS